MKGITVEKLISITGASHKNCDGILRREVALPVIDSRNARGGDVFFAFRGENLDGTKFVGDAAGRGALLSVCEREPDGDYPCAIVPSCRSALAALASAYRARLNIELIGVTGSAGKTSTKEMLFSVLSQRYNVHKTDMNHNNDLGVALTLCAIEPEHDIAVVEMGISDFGEMDALSRMARPTRFVVTNIGQAHLENLGTREGVFRAKTEFLPHMTGARRIYANGDDDMLREKLCGALLYGSEQGCHMRLCAYNSLGAFGSECQFSWQGESISARLSVPGEFTAHNAAAGALVGADFGLDISEIARGIERYETVGDRMRLVRCNNFLVISDCYNANPVSTKAALKLLSETEGRRVAILGDMLELGEFQRQAHMDVGRYAAELEIDAILTAGNLAGQIAQGAGGAALQFDDVESLNRALPGIVRPGDIVLVKASHSMGFERVVDALVRIDGSWNKT